jgi:hypothetical protein
MPEFNITSPSGEKYRVTAPEGASEADVMARVKQASAKADEANKPSGFADFFKSIPGGLLGGLSAAASAGGEAAVLEMGQQEQMPGMPSAGEVEASLGGDRLHKPQTRAGRFGRTAGEFLGNPASWVGPGGPVAKGVSAASAAIGSEAAGQATEGTKLEGPARFVGAVAGGQAPAAALRIASPLAVPAGRAATRDILRAEGVEPTAGEITGSRPLRTAESHLGNAPGSGSAFQRAKDVELQQYTAAALRRGGENVNINDLHTGVEPDVVTRSFDRIAGNLERVATRLPIVRDQRLGDDITRINAELVAERLPQDSINRIVAQMENTWNAFVPDARGRAVMDGGTYQAHTRHGTPLQRAIDDPDPNVAYYATRVRSALDDAMERTATGRGTRPGVGRQQALQDLRDARRQWYNMLVISRAIASNPDGLITPQKLRQLLTSSDDKKIQYAAGRGDLNELTRAGTSMMQPIPNSGTAERQMASNLALTFSIPTLGTTYAPGLAGRVLMLPLMQDYLKGDLPAQAQARALLDSLPPSGATALRSGAGSVLSGNSNDAPPPSNVIRYDQRGYRIQ